MPTELTAWYVDASVLLRALLGDSRAAKVWFEAAKARGNEFYGSVLLDLEVRRTVLNRCPLAPSSLDMSVVEEYLREINLVAITDTVMASAATLRVPLRAADAIHVATALDLGHGAVTLVTHDAQMAGGATTLGLPVTDPVTDDPGRAPVA